MHKAGADPHDITELENRFHSCFHSNPASVFSSPGRTELGGNHTDHNNGRVLAAAVNLDTLAAVSAWQENRVRVYSAGFARPFEVDLHRLAAGSAEKGTTEALIRGVAAKLHQDGHRIGGFLAYLHSQVPVGSGLSSSASLEVLIGAIFNQLFNNGELSPLYLAQVGQYAENHYFGKPCGLMDQISCAYGGVVSLDFNDPRHPGIRQLTFPLEDYGYTLAMVNSGGSHADLTADYAAVPLEMQSVARFFHKESCRQLDETLFYDSVRLLRTAVGDRAIQRCIHFFEENKRVLAQTEALNQGRIQDYLSLVAASGSSSWRLLQNCFRAENPREQGIALALSLAEQFLENQGAFRVHGGGFAGTIQVYLPHNRTNAFTRFMEKVFGPGSVSILKIRKQGVIKVL